MTNGAPDRGGQGAGRGWQPWFYGLMAVLAVTGVGLIGYTIGSSAGGGDDAPPPAASGAGDRAGESPGAGAEPRFPAQYDTLGVVRGSEDARVVVREFSDYQCPFCRRFSSTARRIHEEYVETGRVRYVFFDFPLVNQHPNAMAAAQAARCAGDQGAYWPMHDLLFEQQDEWGGRDDPLPAFREYAGELGVDAGELASCVESGRVREAVRTSLEFGRALGVRSTPTIVVNNQAIQGAADWDRVKRIIDGQLEGAGEAAAP